MAAGWHNRCLASTAAVGSRQADWLFFSKAGWQQDWQAAAFVAGRADFTHFCGRPERAFFQGGRGKALQAPLSACGSNIGTCWQAWISRVAACHSMAGPFWTLGRRAESRLTNFDACAMHVEPYAERTAPSARAKKSQNRGKRVRTGYEPVFISSTWIRRPMPEGPIQSPILQGFSPHSRRRAPLPSCCPSILQSMFPGLHM